MTLGFPGGSVGKNPPTTAGDRTSTPGLGWSHMPQSSCGPQLLSLGSRSKRSHNYWTHVRSYWSPRAPEPMLWMGRPHAAIREWALLGTTREKAEQQQRPSTAKNEWINKNYLKTNCSYIPHFPYETLSLISSAARKLKPKWCLPHLRQLFRNVCQPFPELTSCLATFYFTFILIYPAIILSCYIFHKLLFFF